TDILRAAGVVTTSEARDKRGYVCGIRYQLVFDELRGADLCSTDRQLAQASDGPVLHGSESPMLHRCTPYVAPVLQQKGSRSLSLDQERTSAEANDAPLADAPPM